LRRFADLIVHEQLLETLKDKRIKTEPSCSYKKVNYKTERLLREIEYSNKARFRNKKLKQMVVECFMNMHLYKENKKINAKGIILSLGLKSANIYIPGYNIIKEVPWKNHVEYSEK
jgi:exoribonuclease R